MPLLTKAADALLAKGNEDALAKELAAPELLWSRHAALLTSAHPQIIMPGQETS